VVKEEYICEESGENHKYNHIMNGIYCIYELNISLKYKQIFFFLMLHDKVKNIPQNRNIFKLEVEYLLVNDSAGGIDLAVWRCSKQ